MHEHFIQMYDWKWICVQHPMLLMSDDKSEPRAAEVMPPWGAGSMEGYCQKIYNMLKKVDENPEIHVDFDFSAKELLIFFEHVPEGKALLKKVIDSGQVGFTGTDYSQAHYATARSESAFRGIRMGYEVYKRELDVEADTFQHQEVGMFQNLPQLLRDFGVKKAGTFAFPAVVEFLDKSPEILYNFGGVGNGKMDFMRNNTMGRWCGMDGTELPILLPVVYNIMNDQAEESFEVLRQRLRPDYLNGLAESSTMTELARHYPTEYEEHKGLCRNTSIIRQIPDLAAIDEDYIRGRKSVGTFWNLSAAIDEEMKIVTEMPRLKYSSYYTYAEGGHGNMMYKAYRPNEEKILAAETIQVLVNEAGVNLKFDAEAAWDKFLTSQHHDINWVDQYELRDRAYIWAMESGALADAYVAEAVKALEETCGQKEKDSVAVFNTLPVERCALAKVKIEEGGYRVRKNSVEVPSQMDDGNLVFEAAFDGLGYTSYELEKAESAAADTWELKDSYHFENDIMKVEVLPDGRIASICSRLSGERLKDYGNVLTGIIWKPDGERVPFSNAGTADCMKVEKGVLYDKVIVDGRMEDIPYHMVIRLPHGVKTEIKVELDLEFNDHKIGDYVHDEAKLNVSWGLNQARPEIYFDEPFGVVPGKEARPLQVANFLGCFENGKGLVYRHEGMPKVWVENGRIYNLLAAGVTSITNRQGHDWFGWIGAYYDVRLKGKQHFDYSIRLTETDDLAAAATHVNSAITPFVAVRTGKMLEEKNVLKIQNVNLIPTAVEQRGDVVIARAYNATSKEEAAVFESRWNFAGKTNGAGKETADVVKPYEIFELRFLNK